jgi:hypothetical protein
MQTSNARLWQRGLFELVLSNERYQMTHSQSLTAALIYFFTPENFRFYSITLQNDKRWQEKLHFYWQSSFPKGNYNITVLLGLVLINIFLFD